MNKLWLLAVALTITAAATLPLKAAEQCCQPCPDGVLVGITADSCGTCVHLSTFLPGCQSIGTDGKCTKCAVGYAVSNGACIPCANVSAGCTACDNATTCTACAPGYTLQDSVCKVESRSDGLHCGAGPHNALVNTLSAIAFFPHCEACAAIGCATCSGSFVRKTFTTNDVHGKPYTVGYCE